nr:hypothetical protein GCM10025730_41540 [Promicromonospora thailandica]
MLVLVAIFQLLTSPVAAHMVGRAALRTGHVGPDLPGFDDGGPARRAAAADDEAGHGG